MWFWLAFASAILGAFGVLIDKYLLKKVSAIVLTWSLFALSLPLNMYIVLLDGLPSVNQLFFIGIGGSTLTFVFSKSIANQTLKNNSISKVLPLTAFSGFFTYLLGLIFLSESIRPLPVIGILSILFGSYTLNADKAKEHILTPFRILLKDKASVLYLFAIFLSGITSIFDKVGLNNTSPTDPAYTVLWENILLTIILTIYLAKKEPNTWLHELRSNFWLLLINSVLYLIVVLLFFNAISGTAVALVIAIKRLQIFFILFLSMLFFNDKPTKHTWIATIIMALGALLIKIG